VHESHLGPSLSSRIFARHRECRSGRRQVPGRTSACRCR
jgi:hypothetical protein